MVGEHVDGKRFFKAYTKEVSEENHEYSKRELEKRKMVKTHLKPTSLSKGNFDPMDLIPELVF